MAHMIRYSSVSFVLLLCACGDGESRKRDSSSGGMTSISPHSGGVSVAGEASVSGQSNGGSFSVAGNASNVLSSGGMGIFTTGGISGSSQAGGTSTAGKASTSILTGGTKSIGGAAGSVTGGVPSAGGNAATGGTKAVPCTTPLCKCNASAAGASSISPESLMSIGSLTDYSVLGYGNYLKSQSGFGIYCSGGTSTSYRAASIGISSALSSASEIDVTYTFVKSGAHAAECDCFYGFGDWFSLRRQFSDTQNFCGNAGVSLDLKGDISKPQLEAGLRVTIIDTACKNADDSPATLPDGGAYPEELWWYDIAQAQVGANWTSLQIPFNQFRLGTSRTNDMRLDPRCIIAFEVNYQYDVRVWCGNGCSANDVIDGSGHFEVKNLTTY